MIVFSGNMSSTENCRFIRYTKGKAVPVLASTRKKKKSHLGPKVGNVFAKRYITPPHPTTINTIDAGRYTAKPDVARVLSSFSMGLILSYPDPLSVLGQALS